MPVPAPPTTTVPLAVICSRFRTVPLLPACSPMTRAFGVGRAGERQRAAHQDEKALPRVAHDRLRLSGKQSAAGQRERAAAVDDERDAAASLGRDLPGQRRRSRDQDLAHRAVAGHRVVPAPNAATLAPPGGVPSRPGVQLARIAEAAVGRRAPSRTETGAQLETWIVADARRGSA